MTNYLPRRPGLNSIASNAGNTGNTSAVDYASVSGRGGGAAPPLSHKTNTLMLRSARTRLADQRSQRIKEYDSKCKELIKEQERKQKNTQKLGLDYHIFEQDDDGLPTNSNIPVRSQTAKNAVSKSLAGGHHHSGGKSSAHHGDSVIGGSNTAGGTSSSVTRRAKGGEALKKEKFK